MWEKQNDNNSIAFMRRRVGPVFVPPKKQPILRHQPYSMAHIDPVPHLSAE